MVEISTQLGVSILGMLIYNLFKFKSFLNLDDVTTKVFWFSVFDSCKIKWLWSFLMLLLISVIIKIIPESADSIKSLTGLDIGSELVSFFTLGIALSSLVDTN